MIGEHLQHYRLLHQLGAGGMGVVYEAEDTRLGRHVAIKILPETPGLSQDAVDRFEREARIASSLNHPNICTIYDVGSDAGRRYMVMELLEGESLRSRIHGQPLPLDQVIEVGSQLADALDAAHAKGIVHRDIKPANIFLTRRGQAKLLDFGVAKLALDRHGAVAETQMAGDSLTTPGMAVGSINYMSPEQARGEELDGRTDLFALGIVLYEMATGRQAFAGQTTAVVFDAILNRQPPDARQANPNVPEDLQRVIARSLEKDRRLRFQTAADVLAELGRIRRDSTGRTAAAVAAHTGASAIEPAAVPQTSVAPAAPPRTRWVAFGVPALAIAAAAGYYVWTGTGTPALTEKDTVLIADFVNTTGDPVFTDALKQAVFVQLQQSPFLSLLSDASVQRTLRLMQRPPDEAVVGDIAREACQRAGAKATVEGSIAPIGSNYVIALGVHNCATGAPIAQEQVQASSKEAVLAELGTAVTSLRKRVGESLATIKKYDVPVTAATTSSLDALRAYGQGVRTRSTKGDEASVPFFKQAIERDPEFALAYAKLGVVSGNIGQADAARAHAEKAYSFRDRVSEYERLYIDWNYASRVKNDPKATREALELLIAAYPRDFAARHNLGVYYGNRGQTVEALAQYQLAAEIAPEEPQPATNAAQALLRLGRLDEATALVDKVLSMRPDGNLAVARWMTAVVLDDPRAGEFEAVAARLGSAPQLLNARSAIALWRGQLAAYGRYHDEIAAQARAAKNEEAVRSAELSELSARAAFQRGHYVTELREMAGRETGMMRLAQQALTLAIIGDPATARAALPRLRKFLENAPGIRTQVTLLTAIVRAADGEPREAIADLEAILVEIPQAFDIHYFIAQIKEASGDAPGAIAAYNAVITNRAMLGVNGVVPVSRLLMSELLATAGDRARAREHLDILLRQWKDADSEFPMLSRAKALRATLGQ